MESDEVAVGELDETSVSVAVSAAEVSVAVSVPGGVPAPLLASVEVAEAVTEVAVPPTVLVLLTEEMEGDEPEPGFTIGPKPTTGGPGKV